MAEAWPGAGAGVSVGGDQPGPGRHPALEHGYLHKILMLGKIEDKGRRGRQSLESITNSMNMSLSKLQEIVEGRGAWHDAVHGVEKNRTWFSDWKTACFPENEQACGAVALVLLLRWLYSWPSVGVFMHRCHLVHLPVGLFLWASLVAQLVENPPAMLETCVRSLGWDDPLEKGEATHSSILAWRISMDSIVHRVTKSWTRLSGLHLFLCLGGWWQGLGLSFRQWAP